MQIKNADDECYDDTHYDSASKVSDTTMLNDNMDTQFAELALLHSQMETLCNTVEDLHSRNAKIQGEIDRVTHCIFMLISIGFGILYVSMYM